MGVFKTYDIRGIYGREIDERLFYRIGRALARHLPARTWLLGHDAREHSPSLYRAAAAGLLDEGRTVTGTGLASTPQLHFTQVHRGFEAGVMVTASHNPPEYHGCKVFDAVGGSVSYEKGLDTVEEIVADLASPERVPERGFPQVDCLDEYVAFVAEHAAKGRTLAGGAVQQPARGAVQQPARGAVQQPAQRVVIDVSSGSAGRVFTRLADRLGIEAVMLNAEPDGRFPNHDPNPLKEESRRQAAAAVRERKADFGVVLDGDGDRILFVDEKGQGIENYFLSCLVAEDLLAAHPGAAIVYDLISSRVLPERIAELGGRPVVSKVGYTHLYDQMVASGALFGAETSGHVYFKVSGAYYTESAAWALAAVLGLLARRGLPLSALVDPLRGRYAQAPEINVEVADKDAALARVEAAWPAAKVDRLDGLSIDLGDCWFNVRASNTEPLLRLRLEARSAAVAAARTAELSGLLGSH
jgi:phosphomannomutase